MLAKYILLIGNNKELLLSLQQQITSCFAAVRTDIASTAALGSLIGRQRPDIILLYVTRPHNLYAEYICEIRKNKSADEIPLIVCQPPLEERLLADILHRP